MTKLVNPMTLKEKLLKIIFDPLSLLRYLKRIMRNRMLNNESSNHVEFYAKVVDERAKVNPYSAIGSETKEHWFKIGELQFNYLLQHGLQKSDNILDLGCGNLRLGHYLINYLEPLHYFGIDISKEVLLAANQTLIEFELQNKLSHLFLYDGINLDFLPASHFNIITAHSVFSHLSIDSIKKITVNSKRLLHPDGYFEFTFKASEKNMNYLKEDFYYQPNYLIDELSQEGFKCKLMEDWKYSQMKMRLTI